jgi:hypothetical protein
MKEEPLRSQLIGVWRLVHFVVQDMASKCRRASIGEQH